MYKPMSLEEWLSSQYSDYEVEKIMERQAKMPEDRFVIEAVGYFEYREDEDIPYAFEMSNE